jgi:hypothetical protein
MHIKMLDLVAVVGGITAIIYAMILFRKDKRK